MLQDIAIRMANEGVPLRVIARVTQQPSADVRVQLETARARGYLIEIPCEDWPAGYPREHRLLELARLEERNRRVVQTAVRAVFNLAPVEVPMLLLLLANDEVPRHRLVAACRRESEEAGTDSALTVTANMYRLRGRLKPFGLSIKMLYGYGYSMPAAHRRTALGMIRAAATELAADG
jgi:DNA-binding response OmpR family regulator